MKTWTRDPMRATVSSVEVAINAEIATIEKRISGRRAKLNAGVANDDEANDAVREQYFSTVHARGPLRSDRRHQIWTSNVIPFTGRSFYLIQSLSFQPS